MPRASVIHQPTHVGESVVGTPESFDTEFRQLFADRHRSLFRYLDRLSGDPALAADIVQETFVKLYQRGAMPEDSAAWLAAVANNLFRDERRRVSRRLRLLAGRSVESTLGDPAPAPDANVFSEGEQRAVKVALEGMAERDRQLLLLREEGLSYRELATVLGIGESSVGTLLMRARHAFQAAVARHRDAPC
jgi:RNA polymerase sigma factor (sigma-70 family)